MDTNRIRYFLSVVRTGSISKAAEFHRVSSPALSKSLRLLESELSEKLLIPNGRGILVTDRGRQIASSLEEIIRKLDEVIDKKDRKVSASDHGGALKIVTFEVFSTHFMERILSSHFAGRSCRLLELTPGLMEQAVARKECDYGMTYIPIPHPELDHLKVMPIEMGIFGSKRLNGSFDEYQTPFVIPTAPVEGSPNKVRGLDGWPDDAFPRQVKYEVAMMETALGIVRRGLAVVYLPKFIAHLHNEIVKSEFALTEQPLPAKMPRRKDYVYIIKRKADLEDSTIKKLAASLRKFCDV